MHTARLFRIANRIHLLLLKELGQGIDVQRMVNQRLYARDVLLVCDARPGSDLASLAQHFRDTRATLAETPPPRAPDSGFGHTLSSLFGHDFELSQPWADSSFRLKPPQPAAGGSRLARWLGR
ncbi:MAG: hypothetical protein WAQ05_10635 [Rubrivivax sp.]